MESSLLEAGSIPVQWTPMACNANSMFAYNCNVCAMLANSKGSLDNHSIATHTVVLLLHECVH